MQWRISAAYSILQRKTDKAFKINEIRYLLCSQTEDYQGKRVYANV